MVTRRKMLYQTTADRQKEPASGSGCHIAEAKARRVGRGQPLPRPGLSTMSAE